jgi:hypothetical protein
MGSCLLGNCLLENYLQQGTVQQGAAGFLPISFARFDGVLTGGSDQLLA